MELFFKKVYTVAFRLTGEVSAAAELATSAITHTIKESNDSYKITSNMFQSTILELVKIFLNKPCTGCGDNLEGIQSALLKLKPINRSVVIWKDVLGYKVSDNLPVADYSCEELMGELNSARKELKSYINLENAVKKQEYTDEILDGEFICLME